MVNKTCSRCKETKLIDDFSGDKATKDGRNGRCRTCLKEIKSDPDVIARRLAKKQLVERQEKLVAKGMLLCLVCDGEKPIDQFSRSKDYSVGNRSKLRLGRAHMCKECRHLKYANKMANDEDYQQRMVDKAKKEELLDEGLKACTKCKEILSLDSFYNSGLQCNKGKTARCRKCSEEDKLERNTTPWIQAYRYQAKNLARYNMTMDDYCRMWVKQEGRCIYCRGWYIGRKDKFLFCVDHCHEAEKNGVMKVRGLSCTTCNTALGMVKDDIGTLENMIDVLEAA